MDFLTKNVRLDVILALLLPFILVQEKLLDKEASLHMLPAYKISDYRAMCWFLIYQ
jgi:hypothetical protein